MNDTATAPRQILHDDTDIGELHSDIHREPVLEVFSNYCCELARSGESGEIARSAFDPMKIPKALPYILLNEIVADNNIRLRLLGTEIEPIFGGSNATGKNVIELLPEYRREAANEFFKMTNRENFVTLQEEDLLVADGRIIGCNTLGFPMCDKEGKRSLRMTASSISFKNRALEKERDFQVVQVKIYRVRYAPLADFVRLWPR